MPAEIDFYFDFSSSYSYTAVPGVLQLAEKHDVNINWKPFLLGVIFHALEHAPPKEGSGKLRYAQRDLERCAAAAGLPPFVFPKPFPFNGITASRAFWHLHDEDADKAVDWARAVFNASFAAARDCSNSEVLADIATGLGLDAQQLLEAAATDAVKAKLKAVTGEAMERGVFGAPTFFVGDEMFWGGDRLAHVEHLLSNSKA
jgi:2-hydroxychromene-2-carboxylate isomerase